MKNKNKICPQGHKFAGKNLYITSKGYQLCRTCRAVWSKANFAKYRKDNPRKIREIVNRWESKNKIKRRTHEKVKNALRTGKLIKKPCKICKNEKVDGHHPNYNKPLEVIWLCRKHHKEEHTRILQDNNNIN